MCANCLGSDREVFRCNSTVRQHYSRLTIGGHGTDVRVREKGASDLVDDRENSQECSH